MRLNMKHALNAFIGGRSANEGTIRTDGVVLYSYALPIARRLGADDYLILDKNESPSKTTSAHINQAREYLRDATIVAKIPT